MVWISYRLAKYSETVHLTSRQARSALWAVSENSWRLGDIIHDPHGEGRGDSREPSFMNANEKTELCNRHRFNKLLHTYFYFFFSGLKRSPFPEYLTQMTVKWKYRTIFSQNEMNGPTVKCTMNHSWPGVKKKKNQLWVIKKLLTFKNTCTYCYS